MTQEEAIAPAGNGSTSVSDAARIGWLFVPSYYGFLNKDPSRLHCFYTKRSTLLHGTEGEEITPYYGQTQIHAKIMSLSYENCKVYVSNVDSQGSAEGGIVVQVIGEMSNKGGPWRKFAQTFFLAEQPNGYFVLNDIFRYMKEEGDESSEGELGPSVADAMAAASASAGSASMAVEPPASTAAAAEFPTPLSEPPTPADSHVAEPAAAAPTTNGASYAESSTSAMDAEPIAPVEEEEEPEAVQEEEVVAAPAAVEAPVVAKVEEEAQVEAVPVEEVPATSAPPPATAQATASPAAVEAASPALAPAAAAAAPAAPKTWAGMAAAMAANKPKWGPGMNAPPRAAASGTSPAASVAASEKAGPSAGKEPAAAAASSSGGAGTLAAPVRITAANINTIESPSCFIKNVQAATTDRGLREALLKFGPLREFEILRPKACAFVEFEKTESARKAILQSLSQRDGGEGGLWVGSELVYVLPKREKLQAAGADKKGGPGGARKAPGTQKAPAAQSGKTQTRTK